MNTFLTKQLNRQLNIHTNAMLANPVKDSVAPLCGESNFGYCEHIAQNNNILAKILPVSIFEIQIS